VAPHFPVGSVKLRSKRGLIVAGAAVILALFLIRPGATRLKSRIASSVGMALQRRVEINTVHIHVLPQPGFDLDGFVVHDDPAFGAEPVLRAQEVTAQLRLSSLLRGHLEISRLSLTEPSLNLVRRDDGRWNIENFLERTTQISVATTGKAASEPHPSFPYIEADRGRINFKFGPEKKPFAITDATYAFWQASENSWGMRLRGQPVRSDISLSDTGLVKLSGAWQRSESLRNTPVQFNLQWDGAQLGQFSKFLSGEDRGWRGTVRTSLELTGTPANLWVRADGWLQDFRRYDIATSTSLTLKGHCEARYGVEDRTLRQILCTSPVGDGSIAFTGEVSNMLGPRRYAVQLVADKIPLQRVLAVARRAKKDLPPDLQATGTLEATFNARSADAGAAASLDGSGRTSDFHLQSESAKTDLAVTVVPFSLSSGSQPAGKKLHGRRDAAILTEPNEPHLSLGPFPLKLGRPSSPVTVHGWIARSGYSLSVKGDTEIRRLLQVARMMGIPAIHPSATGSAKVDLQVAGSWPGFPSPAVTGTAEIHSLQAEVRGINEPLELLSANVLLNDAETRVDGISASLAGTHWSGSLSLPRRCPAPCPIKFDLRADEISTDSLNEWLNPNPPEPRPWYRFSPSASSAGGRSFLNDLQATGTVAADRFVIRNLHADRVTAKLDLDRGQVRLSDLRADVLGGKHRGEWRADFTVKPPLYSGSGTLDSVALTHLADVMHENWIAGTASAKYQIELAGFSAADLMNSAQGEFRFTMRDGLFPRVLVSAAPLQVRRFTGTVALRKGEIELQQASLESSAATYTVTGKVSSSKKLDFKLVPEGSAGLTVTGPLSDPRVTAIRRPETQAALKR
jgi:AsmA family/AsmA-like C-terminal region